MYYVTHKLHLPQCEPLKLYVAEIENGEVVSIFPFDGERQSMLWVDELYISCNPQAHHLTEIINEAAREMQPRYLYSVDGDSLSLVRLK